MFRLKTNVVVDLVYCKLEYPTGKMELWIFCLSVMIGLLYHTKLVSSQNPSIFPADPLAIEKLFRDTFSPMSSAITADASGNSKLTSPEVDITFCLFTRSNSENAYFLKVGDSDNLNASPFNSKWPTKIVIHGWTDRITNSWVSNLCKNYFMTGNYNIIGVNWFPLSTNEYTIAVKLVRPIGNHVGAMIQFLNIEANVLLSDIHILGHSLGAHIAGFAGAKVSGAVGRITGMDPAGPLFEVPFLKEPRDRLDPTDASFVDVIHTCGGSAGFLRAIGHADFYPNGGSFTQPGCSAIQSQACSHTRSYVLMIDSIIYHDEFAAVKCDSWSDYKNGRCSGNSVVLMGEYVSPNSRGTYYLETNSQSPYGKSY